MDVVPILTVRQMKLVSTANVLILVDALLDPSVKSRITFLFVNVHQEQLEIQPLDAEVS